MDADVAARRIKAGLARNRGRIAFPFSMYLGTWWLSSLPDFIAGRLTTRIPDKN
jgi:hypothetical protein